MFELLLRSLSDVSDKVVSTASNVFLPSFGMWAMELGRLDTSLVQAFVDKISYLVNVSILILDTHFNTLDNYLII